MKSIILIFSIISAVSFAQSNLPERSVSKSLKVRDLTSNHKILITEDLLVEAGSWDNILRRETSTGFGKWCYLGKQSDDEETLAAGSVLNVNKVEIDKGRKLESKYITIQTEEGYSINCLGNLVEGTKVRTIERLFKGLVKFIK